MGRFGEQILSWLYARLVSDSTTHGMCPAFVFLPMVPDMAYSVDVVREIQIAQKAGFDVLDLSSVYAVPDRNALWVAEWDAHPNARAHTLVANRLYQLMRDGHGGILRCDGVPVRATSAETDTQAAAAAPR